METEAVEREWLNYREAQQFSGLGRTTLWTLISTGQVKAAKVGKAVRISRQSLQEFMEHHATQPQLPGFNDADQ